MIEQIYLDEARRLKDETRQVTKTGFIYKDGTSWTSNNISCHAGLYVGQVVGLNKGVKYIYTKYQKELGGITKDGALTFIDYMVNESPYAQIFELKDPETIYNSGYLTGIDWPSNYLVSGHILTRFISETYNYGHCHLWVKMVKDLKLNPNYSYTFCQAFKYRNNKSFPVGAGYMADQHAGFCFNGQDLRQVKNFVYNRPVYLTEKYNKTWGYSRISNLWSPNDKMVENFSQYCKLIQPKKINIHMNYNIFYKNEKESYDILNDDELVDVFNQYVKKIEGL